MFYLTTLELNRTERSIRGRWWPSATYYWGHILPHAHTHIHTHIHTHTPATVFTALPRPVTHVSLSREKMFYLTTHSTHFIYGYMASDIWLRTILIVRKETRCRHIGFSYRLTDRITHTTAFVTPVVEHWLERETAQWVHPMKDRSDDPSHHERTLYL